jgi:hypothetical protein
MPIWLRVLLWTFWALVSGYLWAQHEWKLLTVTGVLGGLASLCKVASSVWRAYRKRTISRLTWVVRELGVKAREEAHGNEVYIHTEAIKKALGKYESWFRDVMDAMQKDGKASLSQYGDRWIIH